MDSSVIAVLITSVFGLAGIMFGQRKGMSRRQRSELSTSDARWRVMEDYALECRKMCMDNGLVPPHWPDELRENAAGVRGNAE